MRWIRWALFVFGVALLLPTLAIEYSNSGGEVSLAQASTLPEAIRRAIGATLLVGSVIPASLLWGLGVNRWIVAAGGDVAYFTPLGLMLVYWTYPLAFWFFRQTGPGRRLEAYLERRMKLRRKEADR